MHLRTTRDPAALASAVRATVRRLEPMLPVSNIRTMRAQFDAALAQERLTATLVTIFGVLAAVLALVGVYGVIAYAVTQRTHEIGVRLALGAARGRIFGRIVRHGMALVVVGTAIGAAGALAVTELLSVCSSASSPTDPGTFLAAAALFALAAFLACVVPARQAMRVDPDQGPALRVGPSTVDDLVHHRDRARSLSRFATPSGYSTGSSLRRSNVARPAALPPNLWTSSEGWKRRSCLPPVTSACSRCIPVAVNSRASG